MNCLVREESLRKVFSSSNSLRCVQRAQRLRTCCTYRDVCTEDHYGNPAFFSVKWVRSMWLSKVQPWSAFPLRRLQNTMLFNFPPWCMNEKLGLLTTWLGLCILNPAESIGYVCSELRGRKKSKLLSYSGSSEPLLLCPDIFISEKECYAFSMSSNRAKMWFLKACSRICNL